MTETLTTSAEKIERIRGLLKKAEATQFAEEAELYTDKAIELMAKYSVSQAMLQMEENSGPAPIVQEVFRLPGAYEMQKNVLLNGIANVLHCSLVVRQVDDGYSRANDFILYGTRDHIARVRMLHASLVVQMISGAMQADFYGTRSEMTVFRRSWMRGFISKVLERLGDTEQRMAEEVPGVALVLVTDAERAEAMAKDMHPGLRYVKRRALHDPRAERHGADAGSRADIGGAKLGHGRKAIGR